MSIINWKPFGIFLKIKCNFILIWTSIKSLMGYSRIALNMGLQISTYTLWNIRDFFRRFLRRLFFTALLTCVFKHRSFKSFSDKICCDAILSKSSCGEYLLKILVNGFSWLNKNWFLFRFFCRNIFLIFFIVCQLFGGGHQWNILGRTNSREIIDWFTF